MYDFVGLFVGLCSDLQPNPEKHATIVHEKTQQKTRKTNALTLFCGFALELLGRFELPTSSLPRMRSTD